MPGALLTVRYLLIAAVVAIVAVATLAKDSDDWKKRCTEYVAHERESEVAAKLAGHCRAMGWPWYKNLARR